MFATLLFFSVATHAAPPKIWIPGWQATESMQAARAGGAVLEVNGIIYAIGGIDGSHFLASSEYARINDDGTLTPWQTTSTLTEPRGFFDGVYHNGYIYAVGGGNGPSGHNLLNSVERAAIQADGSLGPWQKLDASLNYPRRCVKLAIVGETLYAFGGFGGALLDSVEKTQFNSDGSLAKWQLLDNAMTLPRYVHAVKNIGHALLVMGGHNEKEGTGLATTELATIGNTDSLSTWKAGPSLQTGRYGLSGAKSGKYVYALGGLETIAFSRNIEKAEITADGIGPWQMTSPLSTSRANFGTVTYNNTLYIVGGTNHQGYFSSVEYAGLNPNGDPGYWGTRDQASQLEKSEFQVRAKTAISLPHNGTVQEVIQAGGYSYLRMATEDSEEWIAVGADDYTIGDQIGYSEGIMMENFTSNSLGRTFPLIRFVSRVER